MRFNNSRMVIVAAWIAVVLVGFWATGADSGFSLMLLAVALIGPPVVMLALWSEGPPQTVGEILYDAERKR
jgi:uncharacterized membrane protein YeaQ/YmgE (transglycosylase-associated protein family)